MKKFFTLGFLSLSVLLALPASSQERIALVGGTLIDGTGADPQRNTVILIEDDSIIEVGRVNELEIPDDYRVISTEGQTVLPGLWDPHVHLLYSGHPDFGHWFSTYPDQFGDITIPASAQQFLMAGVTSVRDLAVTTDDVMEVRRRIGSGELPGPTIYTSGAALIPATGPINPHLLGFSGPEDAAEKTQSLIDAQVDIIKVLGAGPNSLPEFQAIIETAHEAGLRVTAHARSDDEIRIGLQAGVDEFQHIGTSSSEYPQDIVDAIEARISNGSPLYWSPTIGMDLNPNKLALSPEFLDHPKNFLGLTPEIENDVRTAIATAEFPGRPQETIDLVKRKYQQLKDLGVEFVFGSDEGSFGHTASEATWRELDTWVNQMGMPPLEAIKWATLDSAEYMGVADQVGSVEAGKLADIIVVEGSPLVNMQVLSNPSIIIRHGIQYK